MAKAVGPVALVLGVLHVACGNRREAVCRARCVRSSSSSRRLTDTHGLLLMSLDQQTTGHEDHDYPVPKLAARDCSGSSKRQQPHRPQVPTITQH
jgi:hypothetical protein